MSLFANGLHRGARLFDRRPMGLPVVAGFGGGLFTLRRLPGLAHQRLDLLVFIRQDGLDLRLLRRGQGQQLSQLLQLPIHAGTAALRLHLARRRSIGRRSPWPVGLRLKRMATGRQRACHQQRPRRAQIPGRNPHHGSMLLSTSERMK